MINAQRLGKIFTELVRIDSESRNEAAIAADLEKRLTKLGATVRFDKAAQKTGGNASNIVAAFKGNQDVAPLFLSGHMDTVKPGNNIKVVFENGVFRSDGTTILGADDKSALAIILEVMEVVLENDLPCPPVEVVITVCEEIGLVGAKNFDFSLMASTFGYILDSTETDGIVTRAPAANQIKALVYGKAAHAGAEPENGINAIYAAAKAISKMTLGRIDEETTCNLGIIKGGMATNIVPEQVEILGEARSHDLSKLEKITAHITDTFENTIQELRGENDLPMVTVEVTTDFTATRIPEDHIVVKLARKASANLGKPLESQTIGGGADANVFFGKGIVAGVLGTGMTDVHTLKESIKLDDMVNAANLVLEILKVHALKEGL